MLLNNSIWGYTCTQLQDFLVSEKYNTHNNIYKSSTLPTVCVSSIETHINKPIFPENFPDTTNKNGIQLLNIYTEKKHLLQENVIKWFEYKGADFFSWLYTSKDEMQQNNPLILCTWKKKLGTGTFSNTHLLHTSNNTCCVLKLQKEDKSIDADALKEIDILKRSSHNNILHMIDYGIFNNKVWILLEYATKGTLQEYISNKSDIISLNDLINCYKQLFLGLVYIHKLGIIHRDIKPLNIFMFDGPVYKIGDFNLSRSMTPNTSSHTMSYCGTRGTMAPEILSGEHYNQNADVWSMLCVILYTICQKSINPITLNTNSLIKRIPTYYAISPITNIIHFLHHIDPQNRPNSLDCLQKIIVLENKYKNSNKTMGIGKLRSDSFEDIQCYGTTISMSRPSPRSNLTKQSSIINHRVTY